MRIVFAVLFAAGLIGMTFTAGCFQEDSRTGQLRQRFVLAEEPAGAKTIVDSRAKIVSQPEVVVVGQIRSGQVDPWATGSAAFMISEALPDADGHAHADGHDPTTCPFCRRRAEAANATALVQFHDDQGELVPIDARKLLGVRDDQVVVVRGHGHVNEQGVLIIVASGIHLRR